MMGSLYKSRRLRALVHAALCVLVVFSLALSCTLSRAAMADTPDQPAKTSMSGDMMTGMPCHDMPVPDGDNGADQTPIPDCCKIMCHGLVTLDVALNTPYLKPAKVLPGLPDWPEDAEPGFDSPPPRPRV